MVCSDAEVVLVTGDQSAKVRNVHVSDCAIDSLS